MNVELLAEIASYATSICFFISAVIIVMAMKKLGKSSLGSIFGYLFIGTGVFFAVTCFLRLGPSFFNVEDSSLDIWWHLMFYLAMISYYFGFKALAKLGTETNDDPEKAIGRERKWGLFVLVAVVVIFLLPGMADGIIQVYTSSPLASFGLHHFIAFALAATVGGYLMSAKKNLGQIGRAIANPMILAIWAFGIQHFWELLNESWKVIQIEPETGEIVERFILIVAAICITYAALRLKKLAQAS